MPAPRFRARRRLISLFALSILLPACDTGGHGGGQSSGDFAAGFGSGGFVDSPTNPATQSPIGLLLSASAVILFGTDNGSGTAEWWIQARSKSSGELIPGFGSGGTLLVDPTSGADIILDVALSGPSLFILGQSFTSPSYRLEKRDTVDGSLVSGFASGGVSTSFQVTPRALACDSTHLYVVGTTVEKRSLVDGTLDSSFGVNGVTTDSFGGGASALSAFYEAGGLYVAGLNDLGGPVEWVVERRDAGSGDVDTAFGTGGTVRSGPAFLPSRPYQMAAIGNALFVTGGFRASTDTGWRTEKLSLASGAPEGSFSNAGVLTYDLPMTAEESHFVATDDNSLYLVGSDTVGPSLQWRIEKRNPVTGAFVASFGGGGSITSNFPAMINGPTGFGLDSTHIFIVGLKGTSPNHTWRLEKRLK